MASFPYLLAPFGLGPLTLFNRVVMAPMTRCRAPGHVPSESMARYYAQRASAGLIVSEASQVSPTSIGYPDTPGIHSDAQVEAWRRVTERVHQSRGRMFLQLWHVGRIAHPDFNAGRAPVAPSAIAAQGQIHTPGGPKPFATPRELSPSEIQELVQEFRRAALNARAAGFDGVEVHAANGYLIDQFLRDGSNLRNDAWGGTPERRARFLVEVARAAVEVWGGWRVGVRLSPSGTFNDMRDSDPEATFVTAVRALADLPLAYVHVVETGEADLRHGGLALPTAVLRRAWKGTLVVNGGYDAARAEAAIATGAADLVSFGTSFLANPDLPERFAAGAALNAPDASTFYGGTDRGYLDYPTLAPARGRSSPR